MKVRCGTDATTVSRLDEAVSRGEERFLNRIFTQEEQAYCASRGVGRMSSLAVRFAAKEAVFKALGTGLGSGVSFKDVEVLRDPSGMPSIQLGGGAAMRYGQMRGVDISISLSHEQDLALAFCVILCEDPEAETVDE